MKSSRSSRPLRLLALPLRLLWGGLVVALPLLGVWAGSSIAAYLNGPIWLACLVGLVLFPIAPLAWDALAQARRRHRRPGYEPVLTTWDRLILRTLAINLAFLAALLLTGPQTGFTALSSRGDWMLEGRTGSGAETMRRGLFAAADRLQWLYEWSADNEFEDLVDRDDADTTVPTGDPSSSGWEDPWTKVARQLEKARADELPSEAEPSEAEPALADKPWPRPAAIESLVAAMPGDARESISSVGRYIAANAPDPYVRVKAIHDFVAGHVAYDIEALQAGRYPDQSAKAVFDSGLGVCAGYANLVKALGKVTGDDVKVVVGVTRKRGGDISGDGHAWNAVRIDDRWLLMDATWDAGHITDEGAFERAYRTDYLFVPPQIMGLTHFPDQADWQLRPEPLSRGDFVRQPMMRPLFFSQGFSLPEGTRSQVTVDDMFRIEVGNAQGFHLLAVATTDDGTRIDCAVARERQTRISCSLPREGNYSVRLFSSPRRYGSYEYVGELHVNARG